MQNLTIKLTDGQTKKLERVNKVIVNTDDAVINTNVRDFQNLGGAVSYVFCPENQADITLHINEIDEIV